MDQQSVPWSRLPAKASPPRPALAETLTMTAVAGAPSPLRGASPEGPLGQASKASPPQPGPAEAPLAIAGAQQLELPAADFQAQSREWEVTKKVAVTATWEPAGRLISHLHPGDIVRVAEEKHVPQTNRVRGRLAGITAPRWISLKNLSTEDHWATLVDNEDTQCACDPRFLPGLSARGDD